MPHHEFSWYRASEEEIQELIRHKEVKGNRLEQALVWLNQRPIKYEVDATHIMDVKWVQVTMMNGNVAKIKLYD